MKLSISNIAWNENENDIIYNLMKDYGFTGLEIAPSKVFGEDPYTCNLETINNFKSNIKNNKLNLVAMQSILYGKNNLSLFNKNTKEDSKAYIKSCIDFSNKLECNTIIFGSPKNRICNKNEDYLNTAYIFFNEIGDYAYINKSKFCIETNPSEYGTNFINNSKEQLDFITKCNNKGLGIHVDLGAMILNQENFNSLNKILPKINHIHLSLPYLENINKSNINIFSNLKFILDGYENYVSIEMKNNQIDNINNVAHTLSCVSLLFN